MTEQEFYSYRSSGKKNHGRVINEALKEYWYDHFVTPEKEQRLYAHCSHIFGVPIDTGRFIEVFDDYFSSTPLSVLERVACTRTHTYLPA